MWLVVNSTFIQNYDTIAESWLGSDQQPFQLRLIGRRPRIALGRSILLVIGGSYPPETRFTGDVNSSEKSGELSCGARSKSMHPGEEGRRGIGWLTCPRGWMISNERIFFYYLRGDVIGYVWYVANGNILRQKEIF